MTREDYIKNLQSMIDDAKNIGLYDEDVESLQVAIKALMPKMGHWKKYEVRGSVEYQCSECWGGQYDTSKFCPNCGAKMRSEVNNG